MTSAATATLTETREALVRHWPRILSAAFILLLPLWIGLFLFDVIGFVVLPFASIGLYAYVRQSVDPNEQRAPILSHIREHFVVGLTVLVIRASLLLGLGYALYQGMVTANVAIPTFEIAGQFVPIVDIQIPWLLLVSIVVMIPISAVPVAFVNMIAVSQGFGPTEALKQNVRLWRGSLIGVTAYILLRFLVLILFLGSTVALWQGAGSLTVGALFAVLTAPIVFALVTTYHYYYYTDAIMVV